MRWLLTGVRGVSYLPKHDTLSPPSSGRMDKVSVFDCFLLSFELECNIRGICQAVSRTRVVSLEASLNSASFNESRFVATMHFDTFAELRKVESVAHRGTQMALF